MRVATALFLLLALPSIAHAQARRRPVTTTPHCFVGDGKVMFQTVVSATYTKPYHVVDRTLWYVECLPGEGLSSGWCTAVFLDLDQLEQRGAVGLMDLGRKTDVRVVSVSGARAIVAVGRHRTFTVDTALGRVLYAELGVPGVDGPTEALGSGVCNRPR